MRMAMKKKMLFFFAQPDPRGQNNKAAAETEQQRAKTSRSVIQAALLGLGHPSQTLAYNGGQQWMEAEGNSQHAIIKSEPSILVRKAMKHRRATPRIHRFQCQKVISVGQLEIINLRVRNSPRLSYFCVTAFTCTHSYQKSLLKHEDTIVSIARRSFFLFRYILIGKHLIRHFNVLQNIIESHPAMTSDMSDLLHYLREEAYLSSPGFMQHGPSISSVLPFIYWTHVCRPATRLCLSRGPEERCPRRGD